MTIPGDIIIPALTFRTAGGELDEATTARYAETAAGTWLDHFILSGTTTQGDTFTVDERAQVLDIWLKTTDKSRLVACCWTRDDIDAALERGVRPMAVMRGLRDEDEAIAFFQTLPAGTFVYSHPMHTNAQISASLIERADLDECLPFGAKISKAVDGIFSDIRSRTSAGFAIWDGSSRNMLKSLQVGADGVVATVLTTIPDPFPERSIALQEVINDMQVVLDSQITISSKLEWLKERWRHLRAIPGRN